MRKVMKMMNKSRFRRPRKNQRKEIFTINSRSRVMRKMMKQTEGKKAGEIYKKEYLQKKGIYDLLIIT